MADDGNRQLAISLGLNPEQFEALDTKLGGIEDAVNKLGEDGTNISAEIISLKQEMSVGFAGINQSIANLNNVIFERSVDLAKWLAAIALATSTPDDNSAAVQAQIDKHAAEIRTEREKLQSSLNRNQPEGE